jgi:prepilin-type N-terminal cleavage/methylation domain-containing protein
MINSRGVTLVELLITLTMLGIVASVATLALRVIERPAADDPRALLDDSTSTAIREGRPITILDTVAARPLSATVWPDGSVAADTVFQADPLGGKRTHAK